MKWYWGILFSIAVLFVTLVVSGLINVNLVPILVIGSAIWVAIDSSKIGLKRYKSGMYYGPIVAFLAVFFLWIAGLPWYLHVRYKIKNGLAELKEVETEADTGVDLSQ